MIGQHADQARRALTDYFEAYSTSTVIYIELPDLPRGRALDSYFSLDSVEVREEAGIYADLGYTVYFTVNPTSVKLSDLTWLNLVSTTDCGEGLLQVVG